MENILETIEYLGCKIEIHLDEQPDNPREDSFGTMVCWHRNYNLGDEQRTFQEPVCNAWEIEQAARMLIKKERLFVGKIRLLGVGASSLQAKPRQLQLPL